MNDPVIPAPVRSDRAGGDFAFRSGTTVAYEGADMAPIVERFCSEVARRTGLHAAPLAGNPEANEPIVSIERVTTGELGALPAPQGLSPSGDGPADERHSLAVDADGVVVRAVEPAGVARGLTTLTQLLSTAPPADAGEVRVPGARIHDAPRYAWRGLSLDVARAVITLDDLRRVVDLLALYKLNVLHLHLTDDQSWRLPVGRAAGARLRDAAYYGADDLRELVAYAAERFVTVVPEIDTPGHASALVRMHPELNTGRNEVEFELPPGRTHRAVWLDPELPATFTLMGDVLAGAAAIFPGPYIHIGGDEPWGMPHDVYAAYIRRVRDVVRSIGRRPLGWQESARAGLDATDVIQYWFTGIALPPSLPPEVKARIEADLALSGRDLETAVAASASVIVSPLSHCYLDVPYAEPSADPAQAARRDRVGLRVYAPRTVEESFQWEPADALGPGRAAHVAGVEAAVWAETVSDFDDLSFLLLPRLPGVADKAWNPRATSWTDHRDRLARHGHLWTQDELTSFRTTTVDWRNAVV